MRAAADADPCRKERRLKWFLDIQVLLKSERSGAVLQGAGCLLKPSFIRSRLYSHRYTIAWLLIDHGAIPARNVVEPTLQFRRTAQHQYPRFDGRQPRSATFIVSGRCVLTDIMAIVAGYKATYTSKGADHSKGSSMNKRMLFPVAMVSAVCPRCGSLIQRDQRFCTRCGAFQSAVPEANRDQLGTYSQRANVQHSQPPERDLVNVDAYDAHGLSAFPPRPPSLLQRTLSVRTALLGACIAAAVAFGLTYLRYAPVVAVRDEAQPAPHDAAAAEQNSSADTAYMTPRALREIDATLGMPKDKFDTAPPSGLTSTDTALSPTRVPTDKDMRVDASPTDNRTVAETTAAAVAEPNPVTDTDVSQSQQRPALSPDFSNISDPEALEQAIKQYGWTLDTGATTQRGSAD
ncbi:zinc ribbon domain-containing protein [Paraburkholderia sp. DD10]|uniref:zinc ribbon domain-containing protein n=1 Tax=Paraburkholderia TaxID=1822464 RepID=UPI0032188C7B